MAKIKFEDNIDKATLLKIEHLLPRLKYSVSAAQVRTWLENFDEANLQDALDFLLFFEYISFPELQYRLDEQLTEVLKDVPKGWKIIVFPYGKKGKSGTLITYPLRNTTAFQRREQDFEITWDLASITFDTDSVLLMIDDFIGSGDTFVREYLENVLPIADRKFYIKDRYLLSAIIMNDGKNLIKKTFPEIGIYSEIKQKLFHPLKSPFNTLPNRVAHYQEVNNQYGGAIKVRIKKPPFTPLGYSDSESFIAFAHCTPNNTLPIIWGELNWKPLYPRWKQKRMDQARALKKEVAFYIGILNRFEIIIEKDLEITVEGISSKRKYSSKADHSLLLLLKLKFENYEDVFICQIMGVTMAELAIIYKKAFIKRYVDSMKLLTPFGISFYKEIIKVANSHKPRSEKSIDLEMKNIVFLPHSFGEGA